MKALSDGFIPNALVTGAGVEEWFDLDDVLESDLGEGAGQLHEIYLPVTAGG